MSRRKKGANARPIPPYEISGPINTPDYHEVLEGVRVGAKIAEDSFSKGLEARKSKRPSKTKEVTIAVATILYTLILLAAILLCLAQLLPNENLPEFMNNRELAEKALTYILGQLPLLAKIMSEK